MILQLGFTLHVRNTLIDAAAAGARYASLADRADAAGARADPGDHHGRRGSGIRARTSRCPAPGWENCQP
ncbi:hypothetical protein QJS66_23005 [Kocuria rhizophila]|nr:hypothetical protein QJS66_23005 [Kocuria rhizophila]